MKEDTVALKVQRFRDDKDRPTCAVGDKLCVMFVCKTDGDYNPSAYCSATLNTIDRIPNSKSFQPRWDCPLWGKDQRYIISQAKEAHS